MIRFLIALTLSLLVIAPALAPDAAAKRKKIAAASTITESVCAGTYTSTGNAAICSFGTGPISGERLISLQTINFNVLAGDCSYNSLFSFTLQNGANVYIAYGDPPPPVFATCGEYEGVDLLHDGAVRCNLSEFSGATWGAGWTTCEELRYMDFIDIGILVDGGSPHAPQSFQIDARLVYR